MPIPSETYSTMTQLLNAINTKVIPNGVREIDGEELNNVLNGICTFIVNYTMNGNLGAVNSSSGSVVIASKPVTVFTGAPTSIAWNDDVQNEYIFVNATGFDIPSSGFIDQYENTQTVIPLRTAIHIAKLTNGAWAQVNNLQGSGSGGGLPSQTGNGGAFLTTNGTSVSWGAPHISITSADFSDATNCPIAAAQYNTLSIFFSEYGRFIYEDAGEWTPLAGGGFTVTIAGFDSTVGNFHFEVFLKPLSA